MELTLPLNIQTCNKEVVRVGRVGVKELPRYSVAVTTQRGKKWRYGHQVSYQPPHTPEQHFHGPECALTAEIAWNPPSIQCNKVGVIALTVVDLNHKPLEG